jgi:hypothetical protein
MDTRMDIHVEGPQGRGTVDGIGRRAGGASARMRVRRAGGCLLAGALAGLAIGACGGSSSPAGSSAKSSTAAKGGRLLNMHTVVGSIEESFFKERHIHAKVSCPVRVEQRAGNDFTCQASGTVGSGKQAKPFLVRVRVTQVNNAGYVRYVSY